MTLVEIVKQLESCDYKCVAGPLRNNVVFIALRDMALLPSIPDTKPATLQEIIVEETELKNRLATMGKQWEDAKARLEIAIAEMGRLRKLASEGVSIDLIHLAETVLSVTGECNTPARQAATESAIRVIATCGGKVLRTHYIGLKNYDRFCDQREDHEYGYGPAHGHIVFSVGFRGEARKRDLTAEEINACLYLLEQMKAGKYQVKAK
jgi:hypothetical protein